jgi:hypothetical protein
MLLSLLPWLFGDENGDDYGDDNPYNRAQT